MLHSMPRGDTDDLPREPEAHSATRRQRAASPGETPAGIAEAGQAVRRNSLNSSLIFHHEGSRSRLPKLPQLPQTTTTASSSNSFIDVDGWAFALSDSHLGKSVAAPAPGGRGVAPPPSPAPAPRPPPGEDAVVPAALRPQGPVTFEQLLEEHLNRAASDPGGSARGAGGGGGGRPPPHGFLRKGSRFPLPRRAAPRNVPAPRNGLPVARFAPPRRRSSDFSPAARETPPLRKSGSFLLGGVEPAEAAEPPAAAEPPGAPRPPQETLNWRAAAARTSPFAKPAPRLRGRQVTRTTTASSDAGDPAAAAAGAGVSGGFAPAAGSRSRQTVLRDFNSYVSLRQKLATGVACLMQPPLPVRDRTRSPAVRPDASGSPGNAAQKKVDFPGWAERWQFAEPPGKAPAAGPPAPGLPPAGPPSGTASVAHSSPVRSLVAAAETKLAQIDAQVRRVASLEQSLEQDHRELQAERVAMEAKRAAASAELASARKSLQRRERRQRDEHERLRDANQRAATEAAALRTQFAAKEQRLRALVEKLSEKVYALHKRNAALARQLEMANKTAAMNGGVATRAGASAAGRAAARAAASGGVSGGGRRASLPAFAFPAGPPGAETPTTNTHRSVATAPEHSTDRSGTLESSDRVRGRTRSRSLSRPASVRRTREKRKDDAPAGKHGSKGSRTNAKGRRVQPFPGLGRPEAAGSKSEESASPLNSATGSDSDSMSSSDEGSDSDATRSTGERTAPRKKRTAGGSPTTCGTADLAPLPLSTFKDILSFNLASDWKSFDDAVWQVGTNGFSGAGALVYYGEAIASALPSLKRAPNTLASCNTDLKEPMQTKPDGRKVLVFNDGRREVIFANGMRKVLAPSGWVLTFFGNGDIRGIAPDRKTNYYYFHSARVFSVSTPSNLVFNQFPDGQIDCRYPDGRIHVKFVKEGFLKQVDPDGTEHIQKLPQHVPSFDQK